MKQLDYKKVFNILVEETKKLLLERQITGFNDDAKQKILKHCTDTWAVGYSVAKDEHSIPYLVNENTIDSIAKSILTDLSITVSSNPIVPTYNGVNGVQETIPYL